MRIDRRSIFLSFTVLLACASLGLAQDREIGPWNPVDNLGVLEIEDFRSAASIFLADRFGGTDTGAWLTFEPAWINYSGSHMELRLDMYIHGIKVHGDHVTMIANAETGEVESMTSALRFVDSIPLIAVLDAEQALDSAMALGGYSGWTVEEKAEQIYVVLDDGRAHLAWRQPISWMEGKAQLRGHAVTDAVSGDLIWLEKTPVLTGEELLAKDFTPDPPTNLRAEFCNNMLITTWSTSGAQFYRVRVGTNSNFNSSRIVDSWTDNAPSVPQTVCRATRQTGSSVYVWVEACNQVGNIFCSKAGPLRRTNMFTCR